MRSIYAYLMAPDRLGKLGSDAFYLANAAFRDTADVEALEERCRRLDVARKLITARKTPRRAGETGRPHLPTPRKCLKRRETAKSPMLKRHDFKGLRNREAK